MNLEHARSLVQGVIKELFPPKAKPAVKKH